MESLNNLALFHSQVAELILQDKLGKQNNQEALRKVFETNTITIKNACEDVRKIMLVSSKESSEASSDTFRNIER